MTWPLKHFTPRELLSPKGLAQLAKGNLLLNIEAMKKLDAFREHLGSTIYCNYAGMTRRGYRSPNENHAINGAEFSRHVQGLAFDINAKEVSTRELFFKAVAFGWHGIGFYPTKHFVHIDLRPLLTDTRVVWNGEKRGKVVSFTGAITPEILDSLKKHIL